MSPFILIFSTMLDINKKFFSKPPSFMLKGRLAIFVSGFTMLLVQVILLRELTSLYAVNELIVGVFLSFWMLFTGAGAFVARYFRGFSWRYSGLFPLLAGTSAYVALLLLYIAKNWLVPGGIAPGLSQWLITTTIVTFVFCFPSGMMFTWFSAALSNVSHERQTEGIYISEQLGSLISGVLFYLAAGLWLNAFSALSFLLFVNFLVAVFLFSPVRTTFSKLLIFAGILVLVILYALPQYRFAREKVHDSSVSKTYFSPYGTIDVLERDGKRDFFGNGRFFSDKLLPGEREELLHPALLLHPRPRRLLLINVGPGLLSEALKYDSLQIEFLSPDKARIDLEKQILSDDNEDSERIHFIHDDPLNYLNSKNQTRGYDVILIGGGVPEDLASTRFYTIDFFDMVKRNMSKGGLMATGGLSYEPYWSDSMKGILRIMNSTVSEVFPFIRIWAGEKVFFIASDKELTAGWWSYHREAVAQNSFLNEDYFPESILKGQVEDVKSVIAEDAPVNTRIKPVLFRMAIMEMGNFWDVRIEWFAVVLGILLIIGLIIFRRSARGVFLAGLVLGGMQVVILLLWQLVMGDLYRATGVLFSLFMAGLALGAVLGNRNVLFFRARYFPVMLIMMAVLSIAAVPVIDSMANRMVFPVVVLIILFGMAMLGGGIFVAGLSLHEGSVQSGAANTYVADVTGGALGSFITAIFFVPYTGLVNTGYLFGMALLIGGLLLIRNN